jgi:hypothetical protein
MKDKHHRRLICERLESRSMMAGNVTATVTDGFLSIKGDALGNDVEVQQLDPVGSQSPWPGFRYEIIGRNTTINGEPLQGDRQIQFSIVTVEGVKTGACIWLAQGDDTLRVTQPKPGSDHHCHLPGDVMINLGNGHDTLGLYIENHKSVNVEMGGGDDSAQIGSIVSKLTVNMDWVPSPATNARPDYADGSDTLDVRYLRAGGDVSITTGQKADRVTLLAASVGTKLTLDLGAGDDLLGYGSFGGTTPATSRIFLNGGAGNDNLSINDEDGGQYFVNAGSGDFDDTVRIGSGTSQSRFDSLSVFLGRGDDLLSVSDCAGASAKFDGGDGDDELDGRSNAHFDSVSVTGFETVRDT